MSPLFPKILVNRQISPLSSGDTKKRLTSDGQEIGCLCYNLSKYPYNKDPFEKATFAKRAVVIFKYLE